MDDDRRPKIEFSGQVITHLSELTQRYTYEGLLEGLPTKEGNAGMVDALRQKYPGVHLISVVEMPINWGQQRPYSFGTPARLPAVQCVSRLNAQEEGIYFRTGVFAWFQTTWAFPIEASVLDIFRTLVWEEHSTRGEI